MYLVGSLALVGLVGCGRGLFPAQQRAEWRHDAEVACIKSGAVKEGPAVKLLTPIEGPGVCGADFPFKVAALGTPPAIGYADELRPPGSIPNATALPRAIVAPPAPAPYQPPAYSPPPYSPPPQPAGPSTYAPPAGPGEPLSLRAPGVPPVEPDAAVELEPDEPDEPPPQRAKPDLSYDRFTPSTEPLDNYNTVKPRNERPVAPAARIPSGPATVPAAPPRMLAPPASPRSEVPPLGPPRSPATLPLTTASLKPAATLACPLVSALDEWVSKSIQPAAMRWFNQPVVQITQISAYSCRRMVGSATAHISEHAFGNALDISGFILADGRTITVQHGWKGTPEEQGFLHDIQMAACNYFNTVLGPGYNIYHYNHFHVDLMRRGNGHRSCRPNPIPGEVVAARARAYYAKRNDTVTGSVKPGKLAKTVKRWLGFADDDAPGQSPAKDSPVAIAGEDGEDD